MKIRLKTPILLLIAANVLVLGVLGLYQPSVAIPQESPPPFNNAVEQRNEMIAQLKEINAQLKEQNALLRSGNLKVLVSLDKKE
jgi:hypothetical protein